MRPSPEELRSMPLFAELGPADLEQVASWFDVEERDSGDVLARQGAPGYAVYVLRDGTAAVLQGDTEVRQLGPGEFVGELSDISYGRRCSVVHRTAGASGMVNVEYA